MNYAIGFAGGIMYLACAIATFGATLGYFQRKWRLISDEDYRADVRLALFMAATPAGWIMCMAICRFGRPYGFQFGRDQ